MIVLACGDLHGNPVVVKDVFARAQEVGAEAIIQVGDFGYWPRSEIGKIFLDQVDRLITVTDIPLHWIDGNHEDHTSLDSANEIEGLTYHPRGTVTTLGGASVLWFGGAVSIDRHLRKLGVSWFENEVHSSAELTTAYNALQRLGPVDIIVTHEAPFGPPLRGADLKAMGTDPEVIAHAQSTRNEIDLLALASGARLHLHGHWHEFALTHLGNRKIVSLADDYAPISELTYAFEVPLNTLTPSDDSATVAPPQTEEGNRG